MKAEDTLFHIEWGDGDHSFIIAPDGITAVERMTDGRDMVRSVTNLAELHKMIFKAGIKEVVKWIHAHNIDTEGIDGLEDAWDKQLKEWGIE